MNAPAGMIDAEADDQMVYANALLHAASVCRAIAMANRVPIADVVAAFAANTLTVSDSMGAPPTIH